MDIAKVLLGVAQLLVVAAVISVVYSKYKYGKESKIQKHTYYVGCIAVLAIAASIVFAQVNNSSSNNVMAIAKESNSQLNTPRDMGNGFRMEPIVGYGNTLKFSFTFVRSSQSEIEQLKENLKSNDMPEKTCNSKDAKVYLSKGIELDYVYIDITGKEIASYRVEPADCKNT